MRGPGHALTMPVRVSAVSETRSDMRKNGRVDALLIGSGDLGTAIGLELEKVGFRITALRRHAGVLPDSFRGVSADIADGLPTSSSGVMPTMGGVMGGPDVLIVVLTAGARDAAVYRTLFVKHLGELIRQMRARGWAPERAIFVSSTAACPEQGHIDESSDGAPASATGQVLADAERQFLALMPSATTAVVVRPSGLYGPGRTFLIDQVRHGQVRDPQRMTHRIHRDDAARAITHLGTMARTPQPMYLLTDDAPAPALEVANFLAAELRARGEHPKWPGVTRGEVVRKEIASGFEKMNELADERILLNTRLRESGFEFNYPTYVEGYRRVLDGADVRYP